MKKSTLLAFIAISAMATAQQGVSPTIRLVFTDTDAAQILMAISMQSGQSIIYNNKVKDPISINLTANTLEDAVRGVSAAAGLVYKKVGKIYVVAPPAAIRDALAPYSHTSNFQIDPGLAEETAKRVQDAIPSATVLAVGDSIAVTGVTEDVQKASEMIVEAVRSHKALRITTALVVMRQISAEEVVPLIKGLYPALQVTSTIGKGAAPAPPSSNPNGDPIPITPQSFGAIGLVGPEPLVDAAKLTLAQLDETPSADGPNQIVRKIYELKFVSAPSVQAFLRKAEPEIQTFVGPETMVVPRATFDPLSQSIQSAQGSSGSSGGSSSGTSSGSSGGGQQSGQNSGGGGSSSGSGGSSTGVGGVGGATGPNAVGARAKAVVLKGKLSDVEAALQLIKDLDRKPMQVVVEVNVLETSPTLSEQIGMAYTFNQLSFSEVPAGSLIGSTTSTTSTNSRSLGLGQITRTPFSFQAQLSAMITNTNSKILARPSVQIIDNGEGSVFIGNTVSVELQTATGLGAQTTSIASFPVGIILLISPRISPDGNVTMHVNPVISTITSLDADGIPQTQSREADTTVVVKDGDTIILGGLIQDQDTKTVSEVPYLSKLPIIGELFKNRSHNRNRTDIIVSLTPHILRDKPEGTK